MDIQDILIDFFLLVLAVFIFLCVIIGVDYILGEDIKINVVVVDKSYSPSKIGTAVVSTGNGVGVGVTSESEKYTLILKSDDGEVFSKKVDSRLYASSSIGKKMSIDVRRGKSGCIHK